MTNDEMEIDLLHIVQILWHKAWIIALSIILCGTIAFSYAMFMITPLYKAKAMMYVNNSSFSVGSTSFSISSGELSAAKSLLDIYIIILTSRTTLEAVVEKAGLDYTYSQIAGMVSAHSVNSTEVFEITATSPDPAEAKLIVNTITEVLPERISEIVNGSSVRTVDLAVLPTTKDSPNCTKYAAIGLLMGFVLSCAAIILLDLLNSTVRSEDYLIERYHLPVLAVIPDMNSKASRGYNYYRTEYKKKEE